MIMGKPKIIINKPLIGTLHAKRIGLHYFDWLNKLASRMSTHSYPCKTIFRWGELPEKERKFIEDSQN